MSARTSFLCLATVLVDEAPSPTRLAKTPGATRLRVPIWSMPPKVEAMAIARP